jgi:hypothetical protein
MKKDCRRSYPWRLGKRSGTADISRTMPALNVTETGGRVRLNLGGFAHGEGSSLQEAADELIRQLLELALAFRSSGCSASRRLRQDLETMNFLQELGEIAAAGGDIRARVFD